MTIYNLNEVGELSGKTIFVDTNILLKVDGFDTFGRRQKEYSTAYCDLKDRNKLVSCENVLLEFINRNLKYQFELHSEEDEKLKFKDFRSSSDGCAVLETICDSVFHFTNDIEFLNFSFCVDKRDDFLEAVKRGRIDASDVSFMLQCRSEGHIVFTDDSDFYYCKNLPLITSHPYMLKHREQRERRAFV